MKQLAIIGASGAIGNAFINHYCALDETNVVYAFSRSAPQIRNHKVIHVNLDLEDPDSISTATKGISLASIDLVIAATGILHATGDLCLKPEKSLQQIDAAQLQKLFAINTIGPALLLKNFLPLLKKDSTAVFAALSARVGSISDNNIGGWYGYRASKAALNMLIKTAAIELQRSNKHSIVVGLHPGTVNSNLSRPYQSRVPEQKLFSPEYAAGKMAQVLEKIECKDSGKCFAWDGTEIFA